MGLYFRWLEIRNTHPPTAPALRSLEGLLYGVVLPMAGDQEHPPTHRSSPAKPRGFTVWGCTSDGWRLGTPTHPPLQPCEALRVYCMGLYFRWLEIRNTHPPTASALRSLEGLLYGVVLPMAGDQEHPPTHRSSPAKP
ncbi:hypothetical protein BaRGS_00010453 [Batillaria attramentaria]|uniref:Uncharacterized protein n=1 Tax=Batillaria attramentaria TaxID=370345 RepID=A0ABD0LG28_9CAEN